MIKKRYAKFILSGLTELATTVKVNDKQIDITFIGSVPSANIKGYYATTDEKTIEALKKHEMFGKWFRLEYDKLALDVDKKQKKAPKSISKSTPSPNPEVDIDSPTGDITSDETLVSETETNTLDKEGSIVSEIHTLSAAKDYMNKIHGVSYSKLTNIQKVISEGKAFNVKFPALEAKL